MLVDAAVLRSRDEPLMVERLELEPPRADEVLIEIRSSGVCHSDWHAVTGDSPIDLPVVLGHEGSGVVAELGPGVRSLAVGDHVALSWMPFCGDCRPCRADRANLCQEFIEPLWGGTLLDGTRRWRDGAGHEVDHMCALSTWATHAVVPARCCVPMPDVPFEVSALIGCGVTTGVGAALNRAEVRPGSSVAVFGAGGVGLSIVMAAAHAGAGPIIALDTNPAKAQLALDLGATHFVDVRSTDAVEAVRQLTGGHGADYAFDAVGTVALDESFVDAVAPFGMGVLVGIPPAGARFAHDPVPFIRAEKTLTGSLFGSAHPPRDFVRYAELYLEGRLPIDRLITGRRPLAEVNEACQDMLTGATGRVLLEF